MLMTGTRPCTLATHDISIHAARRPSRSDVIHTGHRSSSTWNESLDAGNYLASAVYGVLVTAILFVCASTSLS